MDTEGAGLMLTLLSFVVGFSLLVFIHEWGHYSVARLFGVRIDSFAIGFGRELFGWTDKRGVRWKFCMLPLGGYVKFHGDQSAASNPGAVEGLSEEERKDCFHFKPLWQRALIVFAGPAINLVAAAVVFAGFYLTYGITVAEPVVATVQPDSAAEQAGMLPGDRILAVSGETVERFTDIGSLVRLYPGRETTVLVERDRTPIALTVTFGTRYLEDRFGNRYPYGILGVASGPATRVTLGPIEALAEGGRQTVSMIQSIFITLGQMVMGIRSIEEVGGPLRIVTMTGDAAAQGLENWIWFLALISINLGVVNLLPIPVLDGGHLMFYAIEALKGSPLSQRAQELGYMAGLALMLLFMVVVTLNDLQSMAL